MLVAKAESEAEEGRLGLLHRAVRKRPPPKNLAICLRRSCRLPLELCPMLKLSRNGGPAYRAPDPARPDLRGHELALGGCALLLGHGREGPDPCRRFRPLQAFAVPLQALWPLQALAPTHLPSSAA